MSQQSVVLFSAKVTFNYSLNLVHNNSTNGNQIRKEMIHNATALFSHNPFIAYPHLDVIILDIWNGLSMPIYTSGGKQCDLMSFLLMAVDRPLVFIPFT